MTITVCASLSKRYSRTKSSMDCFARIFLLLRVFRTPYSSSSSSASIESGLTLNGIFCHLCINHRWSFRSIRYLAYVDSVNERQGTHVGLSRSLAAPSNCLVSARHVSRFVPKPYKVLKYDNCSMLASLLHQTSRAYLLSSFSVNTLSGVRRIGPG